MQPYDPDTSIYPVDGTRVDLAREFKASMRGPHGEELRRVLYRMRTMPLAGRYVVVVVEPFKEWVLARLSGRRGVAPEIFEDRRFHSLGDAEWEIFKLRWEELTGVAIEI